MRRLYFACAFLLPLVGCGGGTINDNSAPPLGSAGGVLGSGGSSASSGAQSNSGSSGSVGAGLSGSTGAGSGNVGTAGTSSSSGGTGGEACTVDTLPPAVQALLSNKCATCHGATPLAGLPSLVSYANLTAASKSDPTKTNAALALTRVQSTTSPMPPAPATPATATEIAALQAFVSQGYPKANCMTGSGSGGSSGAGGSGGSSTMDPLSAPPTCTSMTSWNNGDRGSASMNPGMACVTCHKTTGGEAPTFTIAGTVYPTGHEPDRCNSKVGTDGALIVIIGADGKMLTLTPNAVGNFSSQAQVKTPFQAKVTYQGRERVMLTPQSSGDCNSCHTQNGMNMAPGRITVP